MFYTYYEKGIFFKLGEWLDVVQSIFSLVGVILSLATILENTWGAFSSMEK